MAKRNRNKKKKLERNKRTRVAKPLYEAARNWAALAASLKTGSGTHASTGSRRCRTRKTQNQAAIAEFS